MPGVKETGTIALKPGMTLQREVRVDAEPFWSIELPVNIESGNGRIEVTLLKNGAPVWSRAFTKDEANVMNKIYVPLRPYARLGETRHAARARDRRAGLRARGGERKRVAAVLRPRHDADLSSTASCPRAGSSAISPSSRGSAPSRVCASSTTTSSSPRATSTSSAKP